jgi:DNA primase
LHEINAAAVDYFHQLLTTSPAGASTRAYLAGREISDETIGAFQLGYALDQWDALKNHLAGQGYGSQELLAAGLIVERDDGTPGYDRFRNRLIIPIRDSRGRVIGFGARALAAEQLPKYLNSPQTMLFDKSATLYGLDLARSSIRQAAEVVIVEGYMDVIQAHQRGAGNVVAQMGTALTEPQLKSVASLADKIVLALDADTAGNAATVRGISVARQALPKKTRAALTSRGAVAYEAHIAQGIYIATLPPGKDPDDILREGLAVWQELIATAVPALDFYEGLIIGQADMTTPQGKSLVVGELIPLYRELENNIEKAARVQRLARQLGLDERLLLAELKGGQSGSRASRRHRQPTPPPPEPPVELKKPAALSIEKLAWGEEYCLALILLNPMALALANEMLEKQALPGLNVHDFKRGDHQEIFKQMQLWTASASPKIETLRATVGELLEQRLATLASYGYQRPPAELQDVNLDLTFAILRLRHQNISEQIKELQLLQHEASDNQDLDSNRRYTEMVEQYKQQRQKIDATRDALSLMGQRRLEANQSGEFI